MKRGIMIGIGILLMTLVGCRDNRNDRLMDSAEACMETRADSARWLLKQTDSMLTDEQQARYALLWTQAMHKCHIPLKNDSLINIAVNHYSQTNERHSLAKSLLYKGLVHKQHGEVEAAVEAFVRSERAFEEVNDNQYKALLFNHYALLLLNQDLLDESLKYFKKSYQYKLLGDSTHYIVSACGQIAAIYRLKNVPDSAEVYYKLGSFHSQKVIGHKNVGLLLQNYAAFLIDQKQYKEAEQLLKESEKQPVDSVYIYNVYSALATLYYKTGRYEEARGYGEKLLQSRDSLMQCSGYLHLYRIHKRMGDLEKAVYYHDLYRWYDSDITLRRKTTEVAAIPHRIKAHQLEKEKRTAHRWQWGWGTGATVVLGIAAFVVRRLRRKHDTQMEVKNSLLDEKENLLVEKQTLLQEIAKRMYDLKIELGRMKGTLSKQTKIVETLKNDRKKDKETYNEAMKEFRKNLKERDKEYKEGKKADQERYRELTKRLNQSEREQKRWIDEVERLSGQMGQYELLQRFLISSGNMQSVLLILELKNGHTGVHLPIKRTEYAELLKQLSEFAHPGIRQRIETDEILKNKQELACLIVLGYDDIEMLRLATNLKTNSVRTYATQVREVLNLSVHN